MIEFYSNFNKFFFFFLVTLIEYSTSVVNVISANSYVEALPRIKISFFIISACTNELISAPNIITLNLEIFKCRIFRDFENQILFCFYFCDFFIRNCFKGFIFAK